MYNAQRKCGANSETGKLREESNGSLTLEGNGKPYGKTETGQFMHV
jgi:hypothetical protein